MNLDMAFQKGRVNVLHSGSWVFFVANGFPLCSITFLRSSTTLSCIEKWTPRKGVDVSGRKLDWCPKLWAKAANLFVSAMICSAMCCNRMGEFRCDVALAVPLLWWAQCLLFRCARMNLKFDNFRSRESVGGSWRMRLTGAETWVGS